MKAIVVDDEKMICMGIKNGINWKKIGVEEVFTARCSQEALKIIRAQKPELMITDINMPEVTGIHLIEQVRAIVPVMRIIVLTGYDKFEYARQCLKLNVQDFLLKPVDEEILTKTLENQIKELRKQEEEACRVKQAKKLLIQFETEKMLREFLHGNLEKESVFTKEFFQTYPFELSDSFQVILILPPQFMRQTDRDEYTSQSIRNICNDFIDMKDKGISFLDSDGKVIILYCIHDKESETVKDIQKLTEILKDEYNMFLKTGIGSAVTGIWNIGISYQEANLLLTNKNEYHDILQNHSFLKKEALFKDVFAEMKNAMWKNVGDGEYVKKIFERFRITLDSYNISNEDACMCCYEIASSMYFVYLKNSNMQADDRLDSYLKLLMYADREEVCELTGIFLENLFKDEEEQGGHELVMQAKRYIQENLADDLSVSNIAAALYLTPNYFSRLFKRVTGEGCNEYIVQERINKAKSLLELTNFKTNRIAMMIGYKDTNYFSLAFKKKVGMSPTKYREQFR